MAKTFNLTANRWKKVAEWKRLRGRTVKVAVTTNRQCEWDKKPGTSGTFKKKKTSNLLMQSFHVKSPVATTCTRTWIDQW
jgi:hypothetical protein